MTTKLSHANWITIYFDLLTVWCSSWKDNCIDPFIIWLLLHHAFSVSLICTIQKNKIHEIKKSIFWVKGAISIKRLEFKAQLSLFRKYFILNGSLQEQRLCGSRLNMLCIKWIRCFKSKFWAKDILVCEKIS